MIAGKSAQNSYKSKISAFPKPQTGATLRTISQTEMNI